MQTFNQSLSALYFKRMITLDMALPRSSLPDELRKIIAAARRPERRRPAGRGGASARNQEAMPNYRWKGRSRGGKVQEGVLVADSKEAVVAMLRRQQILVTAAPEKGGVQPSRSSRGKVNASRSPSSPGSSR